MILLIFESAIDIFNPDPATQRFHHFPDPFFTKGHVQGLIHRLRLRSRSQELYRSSYLPGIENELLSNLDR